MPACRSCDAAIEWITSATTGKPIPVDAKPLHVVTREGHTIIGYISHFATCTDPDAHRKKRTA